VLQQSVVEYPVDKVCCYVCDDGAAMLCVSHLFLMLQLPIQIYHPSQFRTVYDYILICASEMALLEYLIGNTSIISDRFTRQT
jgi:hypothetical protein